MKRVSKTQATRLQQLEQQLGSRTVRTILTQQDKRLMRPERLENLRAGRGKLSPEEEQTLNRLSMNAQKVKQLSTRGSGKRDFKVNRSIRDWIQHGKSPDETRPTTMPGKEDEQKAIRGLRFLGVDPSEKIYYVRKRR